MTNIFNLTVEVVDFDTLESWPGYGEGRSRAPHFPLDVEELHVTTDLFYGILGILLVTTTDLKTQIKIGKTHIYQFPYHDGVVVQQESEEVAAAVEHVRNIVME